MDEIRFDGRVAIVTGAGRGIGRAHALLLASRGARVVVNDLGGAVRGGGADTGPARGVVDEIRAAGGDAQADASDIATPDGAAALVARAVGTYGRLDIVVNNAGIYGTDAFPDVEVSDVERQLAVHVGGSLAVAKAAWPHLLAGDCGRMVLTTSTGALGMASLTAYGTAKGGVLGLGRALAAVAAGTSVKVNLVAPMGMSRMMAFDAETPDATQVPDSAAHAPALVAPLVAVLCHESCPANGELFVGGMRRFSRLLIVETEGYVHPSLTIAPEDVLAHWPQIVDAGEAAQQHLAPNTRVWADGNLARITAVPLAD